MIALRILGYVLGALVGAGFLLGWVVHVAFARALDWVQGAGLDDTKRRLEELETRNERQAAIIGDCFDCARRAIGSDEEIAALVTRYREFWKSGHRLPESPAPAGPAPPGRWTH